MLPIQVFVRKVDVVADLEVIEPGDCSVISIINDAKKELLGASVTSKDKCELSIIFPWNGVKHTILTDEELMIIFKEFDRRDLPSITFDLNVIPISVEAPEELHALLQCNKEPILLLQQNEESIPNIEDHRPSIERAQTEGENEWELGSDESDGQSDDSSLDLNDVRVLRRRAVRVLPLLASPSPSPSSMLRRRHASFECFITVAVLVRVRRRKELA
ncbi:hypothetical protein LWI29_022103 [Acer saccharum]|uniref:Uncharacterized protein n=1 Tax=Acer saccharum TaxID=4024 RepID=A0AA39T6Z5_ACESA|nr:hypothetical protein LWI29_022103 [Acer saccharum]